MTLVHMKAKVLRHPVATVMDDAIGELGVVSMNYYSKRTTSSNSIL